MPPPRGGLPRVSDGSLRFRPHFLSKRQAPQEGGGHIGIAPQCPPPADHWHRFRKSECRRYPLEYDRADAIEGASKNLPISAIYDKI